MSSRVEVVIVGGGYVALHAYRALIAGAGSKVAVTVIAADDCHNFHGFTGEVVAGMLPLELTRTPLRDVLRHANFVHGRVQSVDTTRKSVRVQRVCGAIEDIPYDHLVVGTGGREPAATVAGLAEFGHTLRGVGDLSKLMTHLDALLSNSSTSTVLVAGGGLAGVELAAAVADRARHAKAPITVVLAQSGAELLPVLAAEQPSLVRRAIRELGLLGVGLRVDSRLSRVTPTEAYFADGTSMPTDLVLGVLGQRPVVLPGMDLLPQDLSGRLLTGPTLQVAPQVWAAGDTAVVLHPKTGVPVPANALWAIKAGAHVGRGIARLVNGREPRPFGYRGLGQAASFGMGRSIGEVYGIPLTGALAWVTRLAFFLRFMPQRRRAVRVVTTLATLPMRGRVRPGVAPAAAAELVA